MFKSVSCGHFLAICCRSSLLIFDAGICNVCILGQCVTRVIIASRDMLSKDEWSALVKLYKESPAIKCTSQSANDQCAPFFVVGKQVNLLREVCYPEFPHDTLTPDLPADQAYAE